MNYIKDYKNYFILLLILVLSINMLKSQTFLPPQQKFSINNIEKYLSSNDSIFKFENKMKANSFGCKEEYTISNFFSDLSFYVSDLYPI